MKGKYAIWNEMRRMQEKMDSLFEHFFSGEPFFDRTRNLLESHVSKKGKLVPSNYRQPITDIYETDKEIIAEVEIPGVNKNDIQVHVDDNGIEIKAETRAEAKHEDKKKSMYHFERNYSGFYRYFSLPNTANAKKANAEYKEGVLKITVPKLKKEEHKKKLLEIK